ncbi:Glycosyl hydrolases family 43 [Filimonas lacunae]|uniref:Type IV secretion system putative lipoprotein virB7 n=1 Tax=Filimonas lacunae TaxID=477680 RepID=A0A173MCD4_9BACT|nr:glycoside hydrolase family 43 protein [Filimonas lacunae]BAV05170.1 arabinosidase [Filimonas lacunae]SIT22820.1 Glycosyl hydrolases family 43 [Filimonas lacunae]
MKKTTLYLFIVLLLTSCSAQKRAYVFTSFHEPATEGLRMLYSYDGRHWTDFDTTLLHPNVGAQKVMRDPSMVQGPDGVFHLVWTSSWRGDKGFGYASSTDLVHWSEQRFIPVMEHEPETVNVWAPELFYDADSARYVIIWASTIPNRFPKGEEEEKNNHRMYCTTTKDFVTFTPTRLFLDPGFSVIDAVIVKQATGKYVLVLKDNTRPERDIKVAFSNQVLGPYTNVSQPFTAKLTEGPAVVNTGKEWLIYYDAYGQKNFGAVATTDFVHFTNAADRIHVPEGHKHGTICEINRKTLKQIQQGLHK